MAGCDVPANDLGFHFRFYPLLSCLPHVLLVSEIWAFSQISVAAGKVGLACMFQLSGFFRLIQSEPDGIKLATSRTESLALSSNHFYKPY